jgi:hypothetical protein
MSKNPNPELRKKWEQRISAYKASGLTQAKWCEANDISIHQFKYWLKKIKDHQIIRKTNNHWVPVIIEDPKPEAGESIQIKVGASSIEVKPGFNPSLLAEVIKVLKREC